MEWLTNISANKNFFSDNNKEVLGSKIKMLDVSDITPVFSITSQFFLSLCNVYEEETVLSLSIPNQKNYNLILQQVGVFFDNVKATFSDEKVISLILRGMSSKSKKQLLELNYNNEL